MPSIDTENKDDPKVPCHHSRCLRSSLSNVGVQVHLKLFRTLKRILSHPKDHILNDDKSNVVYKVNCCDYDASYVGEKKWALRTRVSGYCRVVKKMDLCSSTACMGEQPHQLDKCMCFRSGAALPFVTVQRSYPYLQAVLFRDGVPYLIYMTT